MGRCQAAGEKKRGRGCAISKKHHFLAQLLERSKRAKKSAIVLIFRTAQNLSAEGERHGTSHQLQQPIRRQRDALPHGFIHTPPPPQPRTKTSRATRKRPQMSSVPTSISGLVVEYIVAIDVTRVRFLADAICPILHLCTRTLGKKQNLDRRTLNSKP